MKKIFFIAFLTLFLASQVSAAGLVPCGGDAEPRCELCHFLVMGENIINTLLFSIVPPIAFLFVIIGGAYFILGSGYDASLISKAKAMLWSVLVGLLIIYSSWLVVNLFLTVIGLSSLGPGNSLRTWWQIDCPTSYVPPVYVVENANQQPIAPNQVAAYLGVTQPMANEEIPEPNF